MLIEIQVSFITEAGFHQTLLDYTTTSAVHGHFSPHSVYITGTIPGGGGIASTCGASMRSRGGILHCRSLLSDIGFDANYFFHATCNEMDPNDPGQ
jgi:hypothetical protein